MWKKIATFRTLVIVFLLVTYCVLLLRNVNESKHRSLTLRNDTASTDHVLISVLVTAVNPVTQELTAHISLRPQGAIARDEVTPTIDLKLLVNSVGGQQEIDLPHGKRMSRIQMVFPLNGELNRYPFDQYRATLWLLMTTPAQKKQQSASSLPESTQAQAPPEDFAVGTTALQESTTVPLTILFSASIPGIKFEGNVSRESSQKLTGIELKMRRSDNVIAVSMFLMALMSTLAVSLLAMALRVTRANSTVELLPLSLCISLIFVLPALRNVQPGVPPVGVFGDYVSFTWAEIIVAVSAVIIMWTWLLRSRIDS
jgi:hypothetical protein